MATLENILRNYNIIKDEDSTHRRHFMNTVKSKEIVGTTEGGTDFDLR